MGNDVMILLSPFIFGFLFVVFSFFPSFGSLQAHFGNSHFLGIGDLIRYIGYAIWAIGKAPYSRQGGKPIFF